MNTPIIDPMIFYWLQVLENITNVLGIITIIGVVVVIFLLGGAIMENNFDMSARDGYVLAARKVIMFLIIPILFMIFVPTKSTMIQMMVASKVTPDNIQNSKKFVIDTIIEVKNALDEKKK